jgi:hypothetical protein
MEKLGRLAFFGGLALAVIVGLFIQGNFAPWLVAGCGLAVGLVNVKAPEVPTFLQAGIALTVALISIQAQPYNPHWLTEIVLYEKVFVTHALLAVGLFVFFRTAKD